MQIDGTARRDGAATKRTADYPDYADEERLFVRKSISSALSAPSTVNLIATRDDIERS
ncbi:MAG: hypothetical protein HYY23_09140 [Verrucomicrobia bacterium]|nr:hypothetical protein [Verrucomicrobiota bacterium]